MLKSEAQIQYLTQVLGVEQFLRPILRAEEKTSEVGFRAAIFVEKMSTEERSLFEKMLAAMKISHFEVFEGVDSKRFNEILLGAPVLVIVFSTALGSHFNIGVLREFVDHGGVPTIVTYSPRELRKNPDLKSEAWKDMKLAIQRLGLS